MLNNHYFKELVDAVDSLQSKEDVEDFLEGILTPKDVEEISTRLQIIKLLKKGDRQHDIAKKLGVGVSTVTRGSQELKKGRFKTI